MWAHNNLRVTLPSRQVVEPVRSSLLEVSRGIAQTGQLWIDVWHSRSF
jgi:hypothetical protein